MRVLPLRIVAFACVAAVVVFCAVQDRVTAGAVGQYVARQRAALSGSGPPVAIDQVMLPAVRRSVRLGAVWAGATLAVGLVGGAAVTALTRK